MVDAVCAVLRTPEAAGQAFNIGNAKEVQTTVGLARCLVQLEPSAEIQFQDLDRADVLARIPVVDKAHEILGFKAKVDLLTGLGRTLEWFKQKKDIEL
jgi:nucleoside-diphosphate-sugar epimerase